MSTGRIKAGKMDKGILFVLMIIIILGIVMVYSSSYIRAYYDNKSMQHFFLSNAKYGVLGFFAMMVVSLIPYKWYRTFLFSRFSIGLTLLLFVLLIPLGITINGSTRWIQVGTATFMPSELAKITCILYMARMIASKRWNINHPVHLIYILWFPVICASITAMQPHISTTLTIVSVTAYMLFVGGINLIYVFVLGGVIIVSTASMVLVSTYARERILAIVSPEKGGGNAKIQLINSLYAISGGGFVGKGLGKSVQKFLYLSASYNDFIFAVYAEELGFLGSVILILLFFILIIRCLKLAKNAPDRFSSLIVSGITAQVAFQFIVNIGVAIGVLPTTGVPLPFVSFGGSSLVMSMASMGIVLNISRYDRSVRKQSTKDKEEGELAR